ncbi:translation machinery-associated protein 16 [Nematostella vectensis]|uniref:translation machinery-associated protein 16 n=1 Tax=Nematostella vectensis TaxID=45351 RepID=UPI0013901D87|nr:translation machinery-associated protein 16 [Nematostella vectensis]
MPKAFKVRSQIKKAIHPNSRKASQLARSAHRDEKLQRKKDERTHMLEVKVGDKCRWFYEHIDDTKTRYTAQEVRDLIEMYLHRFDDELQKIEELNNVVKGRQRMHVNKEDAMRTIIKVERELFSTGGLEIPDLTSAKNFELFKIWNCDMKNFAPIKMKLFSNTQSSKESDASNEITENTTEMEAKN